MTTKKLLQHRVATAARNSDVKVGIEIVLDVRRRRIIAKRLAMTCNAPISSSDIAVAAS
jgi:hypothetical protein